MSSYGVTSDKLVRLTFGQIAVIAACVEDVARVYGLTYKEKSLSDIARVLDAIERINPVEAEHIWRTIDGNYRFVIEWQGKNYGVYTDIPFSLQVPISLRDEHGNHVAWVVVNRWESFTLKPEVVSEYTGDLKSWWYIRAYEAPTGYVQKWHDCMRADMLTKFQWEGEELFTRGLSQRFAFRPIRLKDGRHIQPSDVRPTNPVRLVELREVEYDGTECNFAFSNPEVRV